MSRRRKDSADVSSAKVQCILGKIAFAFSLLAIVLQLVSFVRLTSVSSDEDWLVGLLRQHLDEELSERLQVYAGDDRSNVESEARRKRDAMKVDDNAVASSHVEFFNPKSRPELEAQDQLEMARTGLKGAAPGGDSWVWLTSYSRVPYKVVQGFCKATQDYCPPGVQGPPGVPGIRGPHGDTGERGASGSPGKPGVTGPVGPPGPKGDRGWPGNPGLDGRDGVPGAPGLDGVNGRSGADGLPGKDGKDGKNGIDGKPGGPGPAGPPGPVGPRGLSGPRGRPGRPGTDGSPGVPGVSAWRHNSSGTLLIPPSVAGSTRAGEPIIVQEGDNVRLRCVASGSPTPSVEWRRAGGGAVAQGGWRDAAVPGSALNLTRVSRYHAGAYACLAHNGVPPPANQTFYLDVHFLPLIRIRNQMVGVVNGSVAHLECEVEAWPEPLRYWERGDGRLLEGDRHRAELLPAGAPWRWRMRLTIVRVSQRDYTNYHCIAKNEMGMTKGVFTLYELDPSLATPPTVEGGSGIAEFGARPPPLQAYDEVCPPKEECPPCATCQGAAASLADLIGGRLTVAPLANASYRGLPQRLTNCVLYAIGKPVYHRYSEELYGSWLRDAASDQQADKLWATSDLDNHHLNEYSNKHAFRKDQATRTYNLDKPFKGNNHVVYNGSFYYHMEPAEGSGEVTVARLRLALERVDGYYTLPMAGGRLYATNYSTVDLSVDDNGLWAIYSLKNSTNTAIAKIDTDTMQPQFIWNISINHAKVGEMFIVCGVLYGVDSTVDRTTKVRLAFDLYRNKLLDVPLDFTNPFRKTTALSYDHKHKELYSWDKGNQLTYPVRYHEMGEVAPESAAQTLHTKYPNSTAT